MRSIAISIVSLLIGSSALAQNAEPESKRMRLYLGIGPTATYRALVNTDGSSIADYIIDWRNEEEVPNASYCSQLGLRREIGSGWSVSAGFTYARYAYHLERKSSEWIATDPVANDPAIPSLSVRLTHVFHYLGLELGMERAFGHGRLRGVTGVAMAPSWLLTAASVTDNAFSDGRTEHSRTSFIDEMDRFGLFATVQAGAEYRATERLSIRLMPSCSYGMLLISHTPVSAHLWSVGVQAGVAWQL